MSLKMASTFVPASVTPATATIAINATSSAYSSRSWPSSRRTRERKVARAFMTFLPRVARRALTMFVKCDRQSIALQRGGDAVEDAEHLGSGRRDAGDRDDRDQRDEERVFQQVLTFVATDE